MSKRMYIWIASLLLMTMITGFASLMYVEQIPPGPPASTVPPQALMKCDKAENIFDTPMSLRFSSMKSATDEFHHTSVLLLVGTGLAIYLLRTQRGEFVVPLIGVKVPLLWVQLALPGVLTFWFFSWGYELHRAIDLRLTLAQLLHFRELSAKVDGRYANVQPYSVAQLLRDNSYIDQWFMAFHSKWSFIQEGDAWYMNRIILGLFTFIAGSTHGATLATIINVSLNFPLRGVKHHLLLLYMIVCALMLFGSHYVFYFGGPHPTWVNLFLLASGIVTFFVLVWISKGPIDIPNPNNLPPGKGGAIALENNTLKIQEPVAMPPGLR